MLKRPITYTDLDDKVQTDIFHFNLTEAELVEMDVSYKQGLAETLQAIVDAKDNESLIREFKKIILSTYGVREGNLFVKNDKITEDFTHHPAYSALFMELATDDNAAAEFINAVIPRSLLDKVQQQDKPTGPPPPPTALAPGDPLTTPPAPPS